MSFVNQKAASAECTQALTDSKYLLADKPQKAQITLLHARLLQQGVGYREDLLTLSWPDGEHDSPCGGSHDASSTIHRHPAATPALWSVMVHPKVVPELVGQRDSGPQRVVRMVLQKT